MDEAGVDHTLAAIRAGDQGAFERLFRTWYAKLATYALGIVGDRETAEDVVQEMFIGLWEKRESLPEVARLGGYLHRAVRNRALNQIRGVRNRDRAAELFDQPVVIEPTAVSRLEAVDLRKALHSALESVAPRGREAFLLSREQGLTYPEIAETMGISVKTVETLMGRVLTALRDRLPGP